MTTPRRTPLHAAHLRSGAKLVDFAGWEMPIQYKGILAEHKAVREHAGIFDVSHMGEIDFVGPGALDAVQKLVSNDVSKLSDGKAVYTVTCREHGGIVDDCIVYRFAHDRIRIVVNASNIDKDFAHFVEHAGSMCEIVNRSDEFALIAIQGPAARGIFAQLSSPSAMDVNSFAFANFHIAGVEVTAARTGYTGEDGFELFVAAQDADKVWEAFQGAGVQEIGLGARDTLRLEARLCLYGNDIDETTSPLEAGLGWVVKLAKGDFVGSAAIAKQQQEGVSRRLIGFCVEDKAIVRPGAEVVDADGQVVGKVTSGAPGPTVGKAIGMAYVPSELSNPDTLLTIRQRDKSIAARIVKGPFYRRPA